ncbi:MAG: hypothetical protein J6Y82_01645 [Bacteroidales bacterium]|nr:hypothetical protein [Bacteroidales bacterium]
MKTLILAIAAMAVLASCSKPDPIPEALKLWDANETIQNWRGGDATMYIPDQYAYADLDKDGTPELLLREHQVSEYGESTGFLAVYTNGKSGLKLVALDTKEAQIGDIFICKNGIVIVEAGNESGTWSETSYFMLKNSELASVYYSEYQTEEEEFEEGDEEEYTEEEGDEEEYEEVEAEFTVTYYKSEPATAEPKEISSDEFDKATAGTDNHCEINDFEWKDITKK